MSENGGARIIDTSALPKKRLFVTNTGIDEILKTLYHFSDSCKLIS